MPKLVWRVKLVAELEPGVATETEVGRFERGEEVGLTDLGLRLEEAKRLTVALLAQIVPAQVITAGERRRWCAACGQMLAARPNLNSHGKRSADNALNLLAAASQKTAFQLKCGATSGTDFLLRGTG